MGLAPFRERTDGIDLFVRLTPKSSRDAIDGFGEAADGSRHLIARVRAVPEKGAANLALERLLAGRLGVPKGSVAVVAGETSRLKTVRIEGSPEVLGRKIAEAFALGQALKVR
jgi:uncharacterized protein YggU (UPF0235/DUF167 family)